MNEKNSLVAWYTLSIWLNRTSTIFSDNSLLQLFFPEYNIFLVRRLVASISRPRGCFAWAVFTIHICLSHMVSVYVIVDTCSVFHMCVVYLSLHVRNNVRVLFMCPRLPPLHSPNCSSLNWIRRTKQQLEEEEVKLIHLWDVVYVCLFSVPSSCYFTFSVRTTGRRSRTYR